MALDPPNASWNDTDCTTRVRVRDVMTQDLASLAPELTVHDAAKKLSELDVKALPVCARGTLVGILTYRDVVVRVLATTGRSDAARWNAIVAQGKKWSERERVE